MTFIGMNRLYMEAINDGGDTRLNVFFNLLTDLFRERGIRILRRRIYLWNLIRGRGFYMALSRWMTTLAAGLNESEYMDAAVIDRMDLAMDLMRELERQDGGKATYQSFVWNLTKKVPMLSVGTVTHLSRDRIKNILTTKYAVYTDDVTEPLVNEVMVLRRKLMDHERSDEQ